MLAFGEAIERAVFQPPNDHAFDSKRFHQWRRKGGGVFSAAEVVEKSPLSKSFLPPYSGVSSVIVRTALVCTPLELLTFVLTCTTCPTVNGTSAFPLASNSAAWAKSASTPSRISL